MKISKKIYKMSSVALSIVFFNLSVFALEHIRLNSEEQQPVDELWQEKYEGKMACLLQQLQELNAREPLDEVQLSALIEVFQKLTKMSPELKDSFTSTKDELMDFLSLNLKQEIEKEVSRVSPYTIAAETTQRYIAAERSDLNFTLGHLEETEYGTYLYTEGDFSMEINLSVDISIPSSCAQCDTFSDCKHLIESLIDEFEAEANSSF